MRCVKLSSEAKWRPTARIVKLLSIRCRHAMPIPRLIWKAPLQFLREATMRMCGSDCGRHLSRVRRCCCARSRTGGAFVFDAVVLLDLHGLGIRELSFSAGKLWGIAGPTIHSVQPHMLWSVEANELQDGARLTPALLGTLPTSAEGLAILGSNAVVLMDGDRGDEGATSCKKDSDYIVRPIDR